MDYCCLGCLLGFLCGYWLSCVRQPTSWFYECISIASKILNLDFVWVSIDLYQFWLKTWIIDWRRVRWLNEREFPVLNSSWMSFFYWFFWMRVSFWWTLEFLFVICSLTSILEVSWHDSTFIVEAFLDIVTFASERAVQTQNFFDQTTNVALAYSWRLCSFSELLKSLFWGEGIRSCSIPKMAFYYQPNNNFNPQYCLTLPFDCFNSFQFS